MQRGCVSLGAKTYFAPALDELDLHGREVLVAYDPMETASVIIEGLDGRTICRADLDGHAAPYFPQSEIERARAKRAQGKLRRLEAKAQAVMDEIPADARPAPEPAPPTAEQVTAARRLQARNQPPIPPRPAAANDAEWAQQILADPELRLRPDQIAHWCGRLSKEVHRQALTARGVDINALKARLDTASHPTLLEASA